MSTQPDLRPRSSVRGWAGRFARARRGNVAILFGFLSVPMLAFTGAAIDYGFATRLETKLQAATDATALLLCQTPLATTNESLNATARTAMIGQMGSAGLVVDPLTITSNPRQITLTTHKLQTAFFGRITGTASLNPAASARCATPLPMVFEIALALDNTGSMGNAGDDGVTKMTALKDAAKTFISKVFTSPTFAVGTKISVVPFAASVAVNPTTYRHASWVDRQGLSKYHWTNVTGAAAAGFTNRLDIFSRLKTAYSNWDWAGCFESLPHPQNVSDTATAGNDTLYVPYFAPDEAGKGSVTGLYFDDPSNKFQGYNSYIDDYTAAADCPYQAPQSSAASYSAAAARACKYALPQGAKSGQRHKTLGPLGPNFGCTTRPLQTLTASTSTLEAAVNNMVASGSTNIHEGFMWGWRTISPRSVLADGTATPYGTTAVRKIIVLMTDGENYWTDWGTSATKSIFSSYGYYYNNDGSRPDYHFPSTNQNISNGTAARAGIDALTRQACQNAGDPNKGNITIFTIGLTASSDPIDEQGIQLLKDCAAASTEGQYFQANDAKSLVEAFEKIQKSVGALRLTQ